MQYKHVNQKYHPSLWILTPTHPQLRTKSKKSFFTSWFYWICSITTDRLKNELVIPCEVKYGATGTRVAQLSKTFITKRYLIRQKHLSCKKYVTNSVDTVSNVMKILVPTMNLAGGIPKRSRKYLKQSQVCQKEVRDTWMPLEHMFWR